jgi:hypothetical protein
MKFLQKMNILLFLVLAFVSCTARNYNFSLKDTLSIFLLNNEKDFYFCIPVQYMGEYQINNFEFDSGYLLIGNYEILLNRDEINIYVYFSEANVYIDEESEEFDFSDGEFNLIYSEENGKLLISKMSEPLAIQTDSDGKWNHYYIFIEKHLKKDEMKKIVNEYEKGNVHSKLYIGYDITIDNELQTGNGMADDFELVDGIAMDPALFPANLNFFKEKYMQK